VAKPSLFEIRKGKSKHTKAGLSGDVGTLTTRLSKGLDVEVAIEWTGKKSTDTVGSVIKVSWPKDSEHFSVLMERRACRSNPECRIQQRKLGSKELNELCCLPSKTCTIRCPIYQMACTHDGDCPGDAASRGQCITEAGEKHCADVGTSG
jgi:hypothetical protein